MKLKSVVKLSKDTFQKWPSLLHDNKVDRGNVEHDVWIVTAPLCTVLYTINVLYLCNDVAL